VDVKWPSLSQDTGAEMLFTANGDTVDHNFRAQYCDSWDKWGYLF
jgi:hypothetical protein